MMMKSTHDSPILVTGAAGAIGAIGRNLKKRFDRKSPIQVGIRLPPAGSLVRTDHAALEKRGTCAPLQRKTDDRQRDGYRQSARGWGESSAVTGRIAAFAPPIRRQGVTPGG